MYVPFSSNIKCYHYQIRPFNSNIMKFWNQYANLTPTGLQRRSSITGIRLPGCCELRERLIVKYLLILCTLMVWLVGCISLGCHSELLHTLFFFITLKSLFLLNHWYIIDDKIVWPSICAKLSEELQHTRSKVSALAYEKASY